MFKIIEKDTKCPSGCFVVCKVWETNEIVGKVVCEYKDIGRCSSKPKTTDHIAINKLLSVDGKKCPFCNKQLSCKTATKRHIENSCPIRKVEEIEDANNQIKSGFSKELILHDNQYIKNGSPNLVLRDISYVSGAQGAGKSTYCRNYINDFIEMLPDKPIILMSRIEDDESFRDLIADGKMIPLDINDEDIVDNPIDAKTELSNSLCVFDDYLQFDKAIQKSLQYTLKDILLNGRDQGNYGDDIYCLVTSHMISDYQKTREILNESSVIVMFPKAGQVYHITRCLKVYVGLSKNQIEKCLNLNTRWIALYKRAPNYCLWEGGVFAI